MFFSSIWSDTFDVCIILEIGIKPPPSPLYASSQYFKICTDTSIFRQSTCTYLYQSMSLETRGTTFKLAVERYPHLNYPPLKNNPKAVTH